MRNVLVTGIPRSGTTLAGALIDSLPDAVCLSEPEWHWHVDTGGILNIGPDPDGSNFAKWLAGDVLDIRKKLLSGMPVPDRRSAQGNAITDYMGKPGSPQAAYQLVNLVRPGLSKDFTLAVKHNGPYLTALRPIIDLNWFTIIALVRHPVEVIHSWRSLSLPVSRGKMHDAARCWPEMQQATNDRLDVLQRQVSIYDLICKRLYEFRAHIHILPYERMIAEPGLISEYIGIQDQPDYRLIGKPSRKVPEESRALIINALKAYGKYYACFYPRLE